MTKLQKSLCNIGFIVLLFAFWLAGSVREFAVYLPHQILALIVLGLCCIGAVVIGLKWALSRRKDGRLGWGWFVALWVFVAILYMIVFPRALEKIDMQKNDGYDALHVSSSQLLHGHFPYHVRDFEGNPISPMPGALILALPFLVLGRESLQNLFWLGVFIWFTTRYFRFRVTAFAFLLVTVIANAHTLPNILDGADYPINWMYICVSVYLFFSAIDQDSNWKFIASGILLGVALSSRPTYGLTIGPLLIAYLTQRIGLISAIRRIALPLGVTLAVTLPFYLYDPAHFAPFHVTDHLGFLPVWLQGPLLIVLLVVAVATACSGFLIRLTLPRFFLLAGLASAVILVTPALMMTVFASSEKMMLLGYSDAAGCFLSLWAFCAFEDRFAPASTRQASLQPSNANLAPPCTKPA
jgi:hypothetical protein